MLNAVPFYSHLAGKSRAACDGILGGPGISNGCTISLVSNGPRTYPVRRKRRALNWLPIGVAAGIVLAAAAAVVLIFGHGKGAPTVMPTSAMTDPYAPSLQISKNWR